MKRLLLAGCLVLLGYATSPRAVAAGAVDVGGTITVANMVGLNGPDRNLSFFRGKPMVINVWASWCGPCRQEMASLERLAWSDDAQSFTVIGISTDDSRAAAKGFLLKSNATFNHFIDSQLVLETMLGANRLPLTVLVDSSGRILRKIYGAQDWDSPASIRLIRSTFGLPERKGLNTRATPNPPGF